MVIDVNEIHKLIGQILRMRASVEGYLDIFIADYFCQQFDNRRLHFADFILNNMTFESKKQVFRNICETKSINKEKLKELVHAISFVQNKGNAVAHDEMVIDESQQDRVYLERKKRTRTPEVRVEVTAELAREVDVMRMEAISGIRELYFQFCVPKTDK